MQIKKALKQTINKFKKAKILSAELDAEILIKNVLKQQTSSFLYTHPEIELTKEQINKLQNFIKQRLSGQPIAYILKQKEFFKLNFKVNKNVLVPRPETEILVETAIKLLKTKKGLNIVDVGTGSGCIIISVANALKNKHQYFGLDVCKKALAVAQQNAAIHNLKKHIKFLKSDLLKNFKNKKIDMLLANLPYLDEAYQKSLNSPENISLKFEPKKALYAGSDGLDLYRKLFKQIKDLEHQPKNILCEIDDKQINEFKKLIDKNLPDYKLSFKKDLTDLNRVAQILNF